MSCYTSVPFQGARRYTSNQAAKFGPCSIVSGGATESIDFEPAVQVLKRERFAINLKNEALIETK